MYFAHTATDERENINAVMQHIGMETCIRFKDLSEDDDAEQNQEYDDEELGPVYAENNNSTDFLKPSTKKTEEEENLTTAQALKDNENKLDMQFVDRPFEKPIANDDTLSALRKDTSSTKSSDRTGGSTTQIQDLNSKTASTVQSAAITSEPPKVAKQVPKQNSNNVSGVLKKPTSKLKRKKHMKLRHNDKHGANVTNKAIKHTDKQETLQKPGKKITMFYMKIF